MNTNGDVEITGRFKTAEALAAMLDRKPMVMGSEVTDRHFTLPRGHFLRREPNGSAGPEVQAFFDDGRRHTLIRLDMPAGEAAFTELVALLGQPSRAANGASAPPKEDAKAPTNDRREPGMSAQRGTVLKARLGQKAAEAYTNLANQFKVAGAKQVVADDATKMIKQRYGPSAPYIIKTLIERQVLVMKDGVTYLVEAEITVDHRGSHRHTNGDRPAGAVASAGSRRGPGANGHSGTSILGALTEHAALVRSIGLLKRTERIGPTVTELERMLDRLDPNLCVVDENDGFALKLKAATPQRRARSPKPKRR